MQNQIECDPKKQRYSLEYCLLSLQLEGEERLKHRCVCRSLCGKV